MYEISEKYGLELESKAKTIQLYDYEAMKIEDCYDILLNEQGIESFVADRDAFQLDYCMVIPEGNFHGDFTWNFNGGEEMLQLSVSYKGVLESMALNLGDLTDYETWNYTNISGNDVMLMMNYATGYVYVFYNGTKAFAKVNGDAISYDGVETTEWDKEKLEDLADLFDFSQF